MSVIVKSFEHSDDSSCRDVSWTSLFLHWLWCLLTVTLTPVFVTSVVVTSVVMTSSELLWYWVYEDVYWALWGLAVGVVRVLTRPCVRLWCWPLGHLSYPASCTQTGPHTHLHEPLIPCLDLILHKHLLHPIKPNTFYLGLIQLT